MISFTVSPAGKPDLLTHMFGSQIVASVGPVRMHASLLFGNRPLPEDPYVGGNVGAFKVGVTVPTVIASLSGVDPRLTVSTAGEIDKIDMLMAWLYVLQQDTDRRGQHLYGTPMLPGAL